MITSKKHLKSTRQTRFAVVRQFAARQILAEGFPLAGNGKFRMGLRYDYKKFLESARQTRFAVVCQFAARQILAEGLPHAGNGKFRK